MLIGLSLGEPLKLGILSSADRLSSLELDCGRLSELSRTRKVVLEHRVLAKQG